MSLQSPPHTRHSAMSGHLQPLMSVRGGAIWRCQVVALAARLPSNGRMMCSECRLHGASSFSRGVRRSAGSGAAPACALTARSRNGASPAGSPWPQDRSRDAHRAGQQAGGPSGNRRRPCAAGSALPVEVSTRSDGRPDLVEGDQADATARAWSPICFSRAAGAASRKVCIGVLPKQ